jgi:uncharacterized protein (DUF849 family)
MNDKFVLNLTPTGMVPTREMTPHVPLHPPEIVKEVLELSDFGVNMVHLHSRDEKTGKPCFKKDNYARIIGGIREKRDDLLLCVSTSGRTFPEFSKRSEVLDLNGDLKPDFASLTLGSLNFTRDASMNSPRTIQDLAKKMQDNGIKPELEVFDFGMINYAHYLIGKGLITPPYYFNFILGNIATAQANLLNLALMIKDLPPNSFWSAGGIGSFQLQMNALAIVLGGGVRIGLEDNIWHDENRTRLATNRDLVERVLQIARAMGKTPYACIELRALLCNGFAPTRKN